jgi:hypothetical protein
VIVFDVGTKQASRVIGHDRARALVWGEAVDYLLISRAYDVNMVLWDMRRLTRIGIFSAHGGDISAFATSPERPFTGDRNTTEWIASCEGAGDLMKLFHRITKGGVRLLFSDGTFAR